MLFRFFFPGSIIESQNGKEGSQKMNTTYKTAAASLAINIAFSAYNIVLGFVTRSWWLLTLGTYYSVLSVVRYTVLRSENENTAFLKRFTGLLLTSMTLPLAGTVILASLKDRGIRYNEIVMISIAVYAFTKITLASVNLAKSKHIESARVQTLRNISFADAFVSIFSLQRSMLVSFGEMDENTVRIMNIATGSAVCVIVFLLGITLLRKANHKNKK